MLNAVVDEARRFEGVQASPLLVFVHGVDGIEPGTYLVNPGELLSRVPAARAVSWPHEAYLISAGDVREATAAAACHQAIAGDAAFVVAFVADMGTVFEPPAPYMRPRLFWQAGRARPAALPGGDGARPRRVGYRLLLRRRRPRLRRPPTSASGRYLVAVGAALPDDATSRRGPFVGLRGEARHLLCKC